MLERSVEIGRNMVGDGRRIRAFGAADGKKPTAGVGGASPADDPEASDRRDDLGRYPERCI